MATRHGLATTCALVVCLIGVQFTGTVSAAEQYGSPRDATASPPDTEARADVPHPPDAASAMFRQSTAVPASFVLRDEGLAEERALAPAGWRAWRATPAFNVVDSRSAADSAQFGRRGRGRRNGAAAAIVALGAVASITGAAILVYANRPECTGNQLASGCGYGTKVVGGAVLSAGIVGMVAGALAWR
jgi:hypothetical protein